MEDRRYKRTGSLFLLFSSLFLLSACGFHPMYGKNKYTPVGAEETLGQVAIQNIPDFEGQYLRNLLIDRFYRAGRPADPHYSLKIEALEESLSDLDITKDSDATRGQLKMRTHMILMDKNGQNLLKRDLQAITSYNILGSEFATRVTEDNARKNALADLARQIELQITLYLKRQPN